MIKNKKSQITVFIIIGIIILGGVGLYAALRKEEIRGDLAPEQIITEEVPSELRPISLLIENCLTQTAKEGLTKLGERGGFIDLVKYGINTKEDTTSSDAVQFSQGSDYSVAYWWHLSSPNECSGNCQFTIIPENKLYLKKRANKPSIESQLEDYINENIRGCLNNFKEVRAQGFKVDEKGDPKTTITVTQNDIAAYLEYPIVAERATKQELSKFLVRLPLNIGKLYDVALLLTQMQGEYNILEKDALNLLVAYSGVDRNKLPPMSETEFLVGQEVTWEKSKVGEKIQEILTSNIKLLQVYGTRNYAPYQFQGNQLLESLYNSGMLFQGSEDWSDLEVNINYIPFWKIYFDIDCDGETCRPESISSDMFGSLFGLQEYHFVYDLSFPVEVEIYDPTAFNNQGYRFKFFLEGNIRANEPLETDFTPIEGIFLEATMLCDDNKRTSGNITIDVKDYMAGGPVDDVKIAYSSYEETCLIGETKNGTFKGKFPVMLGGTVSFLKDSYIPNSQRFDTKMDKEDQLQVSLKPKLTKKFTVKKRIMTKERYGWVLDGIEDLREGEEVLVTLTRKESLQEGVFTSSAAYTANQTEPGEIEIAPGAYDISISLLYNKPIKIPESIREYHDERFRINETILDEGFRVGGTFINYTFTKEGLKNDEITFYVLNPDIVAVPEPQRVVEDLEEVTNLDELSQRYKGSLVPCIKAEGCP